MDFDDATEEVMLAATAYRVALVAYAVDWRERHGCPVAEGEPLTRDLCKGAAYGLMLLLREAFPDAEWHVDGGWGIESERSVRSGRADRWVDAARWPGGMLDPSGAWRGHYWVSGCQPDGTRLVVDIAADQFGYEDLVIEPASDPRYRSNVRPDVPGYGLSEGEMAFGHGLEWCYQRDWAPNAMSP